MDRVRTTTSRALCTTCVYRAGGHGFIPPRCEHSGAIQMRHTEQPTTVECPFYKGVTAVDDDVPEYGRVLDGSPTYIALQLAWQRLHYLLHKTKRFPRAERQATAIALDAVTRALREQEDVCEGCGGPLVAICRDVAEVILEGGYCCDDYPGLSSAGDRVAGRTQPLPRCTDCGKCGGKAKPN